MGEPKVRDDFDRKDRLLTRAASLLDADGCGAYHNFAGNRGQHSNSLSASDALISTVREIPNANCFGFWTFRIGLKIHPVLVLGKEASKRNSSAHVLFRVSQYLANQLRTCFVVGLYPVSRRA
jgi:hypothetical protein